MNNELLYTLLLGPLFWMSLALCIAGVALKIFRLAVMSGPMDAMPSRAISVPDPEFPSPALKVRAKILLRHSLAGRDPFLAMVSGIFHACVIAVPLFLQAHNVLIFRSSLLNGISLPQAAADIMAMTAVAAALLLFLRRLFVKRVRVLTTVRDNAVLLTAIAPFVTGILAFHQVGPYEVMILLHILSGEALLVVLGWTRLSHPVFFFFARFFMRGEYSLAGGARTWTAAVSGMERRHG